MKTYKYLAIILLVLNSCGGGGGDDGDKINGNNNEINLDNTDILGRWKGTVTEVDGQGCHVDGGVDPSGKELVFDISNSSGVNPVAVLLGGEYLYQANELFQQTDNYNFVDQDYLSQDAPLVPTGFGLKNLGGNIANVELYYFYNRFCTVHFKGQFSRIDNANDLVPKYKPIAGTWRGNLPVIEDGCNLGVNPLKEVHHLSVDGLNVTLVSTDFRSLTGNWITTSSFATQISSQNPPYYSDTVKYNQINNNKAQVTVEHVGTGPDVACSTIWQGEMIKQ